MIGLIFKAFSQISIDFSVLMTDWPHILSSLASVLDPQKTALEAVTARFSGDLEVLSARKDDIFPGNKTISAIEAGADLLRHWHEQGQAPALAALCALACDHLGVRRPDLVPAIIVAAVLGEGACENPYHNTLHFKKVLLQVIRLISVHNAIFAGTSRALGEEEMAMLLIAACIHDLGHDGLGNTIKGQLIQYRLERASFDLARPYLIAAGYADERELAELELLLLSTDVSPLGDPTSPMRQMKTAYRHHFMDEGRRHEKLNLSTELVMLETNPDLCQLALMLHEADIATSAGLSYEITQYETAILRDEIGADDARPSHVIDFLNQICQRQFLGDAARKLYAANMARIYALAEQDMKAGDEPYPKAERSLFILGSNTHSASRTTH